MLKVIEKALLLQEIDVLEFVSADHLMQLAEAGLISLVSVKS